MEHREYRLAAIMYTGIQGLAGRMEKDEAGTLRFLAFHDEILRKLIKEHGGRVIKTIGGSFLADFKTTADSVKCALKVRESAAAGPAGAVQDPFQLSIGVHLGDIHFFENDAIGEGINIAEKLKSLAGPGSICISRETFDQVSGTLGLNYVSMGKAELTDISREIDVYEIVAPGQAGGTASTSGPRAGSSGPARARKNKAPSAASDLDEVKEFVFSEIKKVSRKLSVDKVREKVPYSSPELERFLGRMVERGYLAKNDEEARAAQKTASEPPESFDYLPHNIPPHIRHRIEEKARRRAERRARRYARRHGYDGYGYKDEWAEYPSVPHMSWQEYKAYAARRAESSRKGLAGHVSSFIPVNAGLFIINFLTSFAFPWFLFPLCGWGIGLFCHFVANANTQRRRRETGRLPELSPEAMQVYRKLYAAESAFNNHLGAYLAVNGFLFMTNFITYFGYPWFLFPAVLWGIGLFIHFTNFLSKRGSLKKRFKELIGKISTVFKGKKANDYQNEDERLREVLTLRDSILSELDAYGKKSSPLGKDMKPLLEQFVDQYRDLSARYNEIERLIASIPAGDLALDKVKLEEKIASTQSDYMKKEYEKSIREIDRHRHSFEELGNQKELIGLRLKSSVNNLKRMKIDLARMKSMDTAGDTTPASLINDKSRELSQYLDDLREGYKELEDL